MRYVALLALLGGVATVITGAIIMTPETANGRGSIPVVTDGKLAVHMVAQLLLALVMDFECFPRKRTRCILCRT